MSKNKYFTALRCKKCQEPICFLDTGPGGHAIPKPKEIDKSLRETIKGVFCRKCYKKHIADNNGYGWGWNVLWMGD